MKADDSFILLLRQIMNLFEKNANQQLNEVDLTLSQMCVIVEIFNVPEKKISFKKLEKKLSLAQSTTVGIVSRLEQKGLVEILNDANDKRIKYAVATPMAEEYFVYAQNNMDHTMSVFLDGFSEEELIIFKSMLNRAYSNMKKL